MTLQEFRKQMEALGAPPKSRLFACDQSPLECVLFIVGLNPATDTGRNFWDYWTEFGFNKSLLLSDLQQAGELSQTRKNIEEISHLTKLKTLDTNLYIHVSPRFRSADIQKQFRPDILETLIVTIKPKLVLTQTVKALRHLAQESPTLAETPLEIQRIHWRGLALKVIHCPRHLGYVKGRSELESIVRAISAAC